MAANLLNCRCLNGGALCVSTQGTILVFADYQSFRRHGKHVAVADTDFTHQRYPTYSIVFSFSGELTLDVQNPGNQYLHIGKNWWDSLPDTSFESKENQATWIYYLSDVLELLSVSE